MSTSLLHEIGDSPPIFMQGDGGGAGELRPTKLSPAPQVNVPALPAPGAPSWAAGGARIFVHPSFHFMLRHSFVSDVARGRNLTPDGSFHCVFVCHSFGLAYLAQNLHVIGATTRCVLALSLSSPLPAPSSFIQCNVLHGHSSVSARTLSQCVTTAIRHGAVVVSIGGSPH